MARFAASTKVGVDQTRVEIERTLSRYGATAFAYMSQAGKAIIAFEAQKRHIKITVPLPAGDSDKEKQEAGLELYGTGVAIWHDTERSGKWNVIRLDKEDIRQPGQYQRQYAFNPSQARVPAGGGPMVIAGRSYQGGQWVPAQVASQATPAQKKELESAHVGSTQQKMAKGPVSPKKVAARAVAGSGAQELSGDQMRHGRQTYKALMRHHGEMLRRWGRSLP